jgi:hypothetical protein
VTAVLGWVIATAHTSGSHTYHTIWNYDAESDSHYVIFGPETSAHMQEDIEGDEFLAVVIPATDLDALHAKLAEQEAEIARLRNPDLTEAVERAAKANFNRVRDRALADGRSAFTTEWDDLPASERHVWREHLVPIVVAALWRGTR